MLSYSLDRQVIMQKKYKKVEMSGTVLILLEINIQCTSSRSITATYILDAQKLVEDPKMLEAKNISTSCKKQDACQKTDNQPPSPKASNLTNKDSGIHGMPPDPNPDFEFFDSFFTRAELSSINDFVAQGGLGPDPASDYFIERTKAIRYVLTLPRPADSRLIDRPNFALLTENYFYQNEGYNDHSGGYKREFHLIPEHIITGPMRRALEKYIEYNQMPEKTVLFVILQTSVLRDGNL